VSTLHPAEPRRIELARLPTPVVELKNLAAHLGAKQVLLKRDDLTGLEVTGNKVRKLEYVIADAIHGGADVLVTHGGFQSNHCRATAALGARLGLRVRMVLRSPEADPPNDGNLFLDRLFGADITLHDAETYNTRRQSLIDEAMDAEHAAGRRPYFFPVGASVPLGCWGYIRCMAELAEQLDRDRAIDVFVPTCSLGTLVGLVMGKGLLGCDNWRVLGVPVCSTADELRREARRLERQTVAEYQLDLDEEQTPIEMVEGFVGEGYAIPYPESLEAIRLLARIEGVLLDPTYTSKAMAGMLAVIRGGQVRSGAVPLFIHTGGAFGLMARRDLFPPE
jgi:D-cysteine desulfhydrase